MPELSLGTHACLGSPEDNTWQMLAEMGVSFCCATPSTQGWGHSPHFVSEE